MRTLFLLATLMLSFMASAQSVVFAAPVTITATVTSSVLLAPNGKRVYLLVVNNGAQAVTLKFGSVQSGSEGIVVPSGGVYEPLQAPANVMYGKTGSATSSLTIIQGQNSP